LKAAELLKQYLGDAFNQEGVPDVGNVRTWEKERHDLARNVLGILRSPSNTGRFQLDIASDRPRKSTLGCSTASGSVASGVRP